MIKGEKYMNAREFTNQLEELINNPAQKLVGNISSGYINLTDDEVRKRCIMASAISSVPSEISTAYISYDKCGKNIHNQPFSITKVIFNPPATIVLWNDDTKTVVKTRNGEAFDPEKGLAMAISKKAFGNKGNYFEQIKKWTEPYKEEKSEFEIDLINFLKELGDLTLNGYKSGLTKNE